jgi:transmembrane sensor
MSDELRPLSLLHKELTASLDEAERGALDQWRRTDPQADELAESVRETWRMAGEADPAAHWSPDADVAWKRFACRLSEPPLTNAVRPTGPQSAIWRMPTVWAAAAAVALLIGAGLWWALRPGNAAEVLLVAEADRTPTVHLADGSVVHLRRGSRLHYPEHFGTNVHRVRLEGEAFFEVAPQASGHLFRVETRTAQVEVLGTAFNLREDSGSGTCAVAVHEGSVRLTAGGPMGGGSVVLNSGESALYDAAKLRLTKSSGRAANDAAWFTGELRFRDVPLTAVLDDLQNGFGVRATLDPADWADCLFSGTIRREALREHLTALARAFGGQLEATPTGAYQLTGGRCR